MDLSTLSIAARPYATRALKELARAEQCRLDGSLKQARICLTLARTHLSIAAGIEYQANNPVD